jgi:hypothetical protein
MTRIEWVHHPLRNNGFTPFHAEPKQEDIVCGDGPRRTIDIRDFATKYSAYSVEFEASVADKAKLSGKVTPAQLQQLSEALQSAQDFRKFVVAGYNSCAIDKEQYAKFGARFQALDNVSRQINSLASKPALSNDEESELSKLIEAYVALGRKLGE